MFLKIIIKNFLLWLFLLLPFSLLASEKTVLNINSAPQSINVLYTLKQLQQLPQHEIRTKSPWTNGVHIYKGPYLDDVLKLAKTEGDWLTLHALDSYQISFNYQRIKKYNPILALQIDGTLLTVRTKGPIWLMLPIDEFKELGTAIYQDYMVWQLVKIDVEDK